MAPTAPTAGTRVWARAAGGAWQRATVLSNDMTSSITVTLDGSGAELRVEASDVELVNDGVVEVRPPPPPH